MTLNGLSVNMAPKKRKAQAKPPTPVEVKDEADDATIGTAETEVQENILAEGNGVFIHAGGSKYG
jgi:hypothetical protein